MLILSTYDQPNLETLLIVANPTRWNYQQIYSEFILVGKDNLGRMEWYVTNKLSHAMHIHMEVVYAREEEMIT